MQCRDVPLLEMCAAHFDSVSESFPVRLDWHGCSPHSLFSSDVKDLGFAVMEALVYSMLLLIPRQSWLRNGRYRGVGLSIQLPAELIFQA